MLSFDPSNLGGICNAWVTICRFGLLTLCFRGAMIVSLEEQELERVRGMGVLE